jgi:hypothetical protein
MINNKDANDIKQKAFESLKFDGVQMKVVEYFADHQQEIIDLISKQLVSG